MLFESDSPYVRAATRQPDFLTGQSAACPRSGMLPARHFETTGKSMTSGTVKFFNTTKGYGFISPEGGGKDVFVHATAVEAAGMRSLQEGQRVSFDIEPDARGSKAVNLKAE
jgi:CspA family cold shock protein